MVFGENFAKKCRNSKKKTGISQLKCKNGKYAQKIAIIYTQAQII